MATKKKEYYVDLATLIFWGSGTGKTRIIDEVLYLIKEDIPSYIVVTNGNS
jgi:hypothetical protein